MKKLRIIPVLFVLAFAFLPSISFAESSHPDTVKTGIYITSIHDIDFKQNEYNINLWLWLTYTNKELDFLQNLEIPQAKTFTKSFSTVDSSNGKMFILMKLQCVMKDNWKINNFPFDRQNLRFSIENSQFDSKDFVFVCDTIGEHFDKKFTLRGWDIDSFKMATGTKVYETAFGDSIVGKPRTEYSSFKVKLGIRRDALELFAKMFLGMYVAFLLAFVCFFIHADNIDSRFGLSVGSLFAVIGNKYIVDSSLPDSTTFTLVDTLHGITLFFIFAVVACSAYALQLGKKDQLTKANRFDSIAARVLLIGYLIFNVYYIYNAV